MATFPEALIRRPLLASCPQAICTVCDQPWQRQVPTTGALIASCSCSAPTQPGIVLDPFFGSGTVGVTANKLGRDWIGIELNPAYVQLAQARLALPATPSFNRSSANETD